MSQRQGAACDPPAVRPWNVQTVHGKIQHQLLKMRNAMLTLMKRIPVHQIFRMLANGDSVDSLLRAYPTLQREDILACFDYAAALAEEEVTPLETVGAE
jgi:hypothetical protein